MILAILLVGMGCGRGNVPISESIFEEEGSIALVWMSTDETGQFYRTGSQGLLDMLITEVSKGSLEDHVKTIKMNAVVEADYLHPYGKKFSDKGMESKFLRLPLDESALKSVSRDKRKKSKLTAPYDFAFLRQSQGVRYVLFLDVEEFGVTQSFYSMIPTSDPKGHAKIKILLIDTDTNEVVSEYYQEINIDAVGSWDEPPLYESVSQAVNRALSKVLNDGMVELFQLDVDEVDAEKDGREGESR